MLVGKKRSKALVQWGYSGELLKVGKEVGNRTEL